MRAGSKTYGGISKENSEVLQSKGQTQELHARRLSIEEAPTSKKESSAWEVGTQLGRSLHHIPSRQIRQLRTPNRRRKDLATHVECGTSQTLLPIDNGL